MLFCLRQNSIFNFNIFHLLANLLAKPIDGILLIYYRGFAALFFYSLFSAAFAAVFFLCTKKQNGGSAQAAWRKWGENLCYNANRSSAPTCAKPPPDHSLFFLFSLRQSRKNPPCFSCRKAAMFFLIFLIFSKKSPENILQNG